MRTVSGSAGSHRPALLKRARQLDAQLKQLAPPALARLMHISMALAGTTHELIAGWGDGPTTAALDAFQGDIYRGLKAPTFSASQRAYANTVLRIMSGLYGLIEPFDAVEPYRLELAYRLVTTDAANLYEFWGDAVARQLPPTGTIVQLASMEYFRVVERFIDPMRVVAPRFMSYLPGQAEPVFVAVHAKVARGAMARWLIATRTTDSAEFSGFDYLGYHYNAAGSRPRSPLFIKALGSPLS